MNAVWSFQTTIDSVERDGADGAADLRRAEPLSLGTLDLSEYWARAGALNLSERYQLATFHPSYQFAEVEQDDRQRNQPITISDVLLRREDVQDAIKIIPTR